MEERRDDGDGLDPGGGPADRRASSPVTSAALLAGLTAAQRRAATHLGGPMLVVAGPGAGKTKTLTARLGHLIVSGHARPEELLAVTFTRKAAAEVRGRLEALLGAPARAVRVGTFHAIAAALRPPAGPVLGGADRQALLGRAAAEAAVPVRALEEALSLKKARPLTEVGPRAMAEAPGASAAAPAGPPWEAGRALARGVADEAPTCGAAAGAPTCGASDEALARGVAAYEALLHAIGAIDLDDLLLGALAALSAAPPDALAAGAGPPSGPATPPWRYLCVDEYQDTNGVQRALCRALGGAEGNVFAIGDPDQAIYAFRGADVGNFYAFPTDFPGAAIVDLRENFRSTETIVSAAAAVIGHNRRPGRGAPAATRAAGAPIELLEAASDLGEGERIAREIERLLGGTSLSSYDTGRAAAHDGSAYSFCDVAVLARTGARADALARVLARAGLPVQRPQRALLDGAEARALLAELRLAEDPRDGGALLSVLGRAAPKRLTALLAGGRLSLDVLDDATRALLDARREGLCALPYPERIVAAAELVSAPEEVRAAALSLAERQGPAALLRDDGLGHEADELEPRAERVSVLTMHGAKGLEFPVVFVAGCEAQLLPGPGRDDEELAEERRLFYVAMTRARDRLYLSWARRGPRGEAAPSPFLQEVPPSLVLSPKAPAPRRRAGQMKLF